MLQGFFEGWPKKPSQEAHLDLLRGSDFKILAVDDTRKCVVGFVTAISDGVLSAYIPFLEVLPAYRGRSIGQELARRMLEKLRGFYMVDLTCDPEMEPFYTKLGMRRATAMIVRNYERQSGGQDDA